MQQLIFIKPFDFDPICMEMHAAVQQNRHSESLYKINLN